MIIKWKPFWYEMDQTIIVGDKDSFDITKDENNRSFSNGFYSVKKDSFISKNMEIVSIRHPVLGDIKGIVTIGLDYTIYLASGKVLEVNAEEQPGKIYDPTYVIDDWTFDVDADFLDDNEESIEESKPTSHKETIDHYKELLGITEASWD